MPNTKEIHLIVNRANGLPKPLGVASGIWQTGDWVCSKDRAEALIGGTVLLFEEQTGPSFHGGEILGYEVVPENAPTAGLVRFNYRVMPDGGKGRRSGRDGWGNERKFVGF